MIERPETKEYPPYFAKYISLVPEGDLIRLLSDQADSILSLLGNLSDTDACYRYAPSKWSIKEVIGHIADTERIMSYRLLRIARGDKTPLAGFEQDEYIIGASFDSCSFQDLLDDYSAVRKSTLTLLTNLAKETWARIGTVNNNVISARALACVIAGHELHHRNIINERYLS